MKALKGTAVIDGPICEEIEAWPVPLNALRLGDVS
jgi:hypothetical protein